MPVAMMDAIIGLASLLGRFSASWADRAEFARTGRYYATESMLVWDAGKYVELRAEMDVIVLVSNCPQLNNPCNAYNPTPVRMFIWD